MHARVEVTAAVWAISTLPLSGELQPAHYCHNGVPATLCHVIRPSACPARLCVAQWSPSCRGVLASHTRGLDAYLNRQAQRIDQRHPDLLAPERYRDFLAERRRLITERLNTFLTP